jgi:Protein of unknown function (DUF3619)
MSRSASSIDSVFAPAASHDVIEARFARRVAACLTESAEQLPHDISERLRVSRQQAVERARALRKLSPQVVPSAAQGHPDGTLTWSGPPSWWLRLASFVPLAVLVGGLLLIQHRYNEQQISAAAEVDSALLIDELPPQAYSDPGFVEFLRAPQVHQ